MGSRAWLSPPPDDTKLSSQWGRTLSSQTPTANRPAGPLGRHQTRGRNGRLSREQWEKPPQSWQCSQKWHVDTHEGDTRNMQQEGNQAKEHTAAACSRAGAPGREGGCRGADTAVPGRRLLVSLRRCPPSMPTPSTTSTPFSRHLLTHRLRPQSWEGGEDASLPLPHPPPQTPHQSL